MASGFEATFSFDRQGVAGLPTEIKRKNKPKDAIPENGIFILFGYIYDHINGYSQDQPANYLFFTRRF